jgi:hypothetical protein
LPFNQSTNKPINELTFVLCPFALLLKPYARRLLALRSLEGEEGMPLFFSQ